MDKSKTVILGSGVSGIGAVKLAQKKGLDIFLSDSKNIKSETKKLLSKLAVKYEESGHTEKLIKDSKEIIISPGIDLRSLIKSKPSLKKKKIISEIEFASRYTNAFIIAVTGLNVPKILEQFRIRVSNNYLEELNEAIFQVHKIAEIRIKQKINLTEK